MDQYTIQTWQLGPLQTNTYLVVDEINEVSWLVDPAADGDFLSEQILASNTKLTSVLLTHGHSDHAGGLLPIMLNFSPSVLLHKADTFLARKNQQYRTENDPIPLPTDFFDETSTPKNSAFTTLLLPGHTPGSVGYYFAAAKVIFTGDTVFSYGIENNKREYEDLEQLQQSIKRLQQLPAETRICPGHGETFRVSEIKIETATFLE